MSEREKLPFDTWEYKGQTKMTTQKLRNGTKVKIINTTKEKYLNQVGEVIDKRKSERAGSDVICNKLLAKISPGTSIQIRCPRCGAFVESNEIVKD